MITYHLPPFSLWRNGNMSSFNGKARLDNPAVDDLGEDAFLGHDAIPGGLFDGAAGVVAFLADLGNFKHHLAVKNQTVADGKRRLYNADGAIKKILICVSGKSGAD